MSKKKTEFKTWHGILLAGILLTAAILGILQRTSEPVQHQGAAILNEQTCLVSGGDWNSCGSACRENPNAPCIEVCVAYCECQADDQCPFGYSCGGFIDGVGVCQVD